MEKGFCMNCLLHSSRFVAFILCLAVLIPSASAFAVQSYSADYDVLDHKTIVTITLEFKETTSGFTWRVPSDAMSFEADNLTYTIEQFDNYKEFSTSQSIKQAHFSYTTESLVEDSDDEFFVLDFSGIYYNKLSIVVRLPEDAKLKYSLDSPNSAIIPRTNNVVTDGRRIIVRWSELDFRTSQALLVIYEQPETHYAAYIIAAVAVIILAGAVTYFSFNSKQSKKEKPKTASRGDTGITRNLFAEEKLIVEALLAEKSSEMWQKTLQIKTGLNKVKLSRKLRSLEAKGLIEKVPYGNTKKIRLKND